MYSLLLPSCFCDRSPAALDTPADWRRRGLSATPTVRAMVRSSATGLLRVGAMSRRQPRAARAPAGKWSLV